eukprot:scaffold136114_cov29-Tisochrysis_lutea.AAC.2
MIRSRMRMRQTRPLVLYLGAQCQRVGFPVAGGRRRVPIPDGPAVLGFLLRRRAISLFVIAYILQDDKDGGGGAGEATCPPPCAEGVNLVAVVALESRAWREYHEVYCTQAWPRSTRCASKESNHVDQ